MAIACYNSVMKNEPKKKHMSTGKLVTLIASASVLFIVISFAAYLFIVTKVNQLSAQLTEQSVIAAREEYENAGGVTRLKTLNTLQEAGITRLRDGTNHSSRVDTCSLTGNSSGWTVSTWYQTCHVRYVDILETNSSLQNVRTALTKGNNSIEDDSDAPEASSCTPLKIKMGDAVAYIVYVPAGKLEVTPEKSSSDHICSVPFQSDIELSGDGQIVKGSDFIAKKYYTFDQSKINSSKAYIYTVRDGTYSHEDVGCGDSLILCEKPDQTKTTGF